MAARPTVSLAALQTDIAARCQRILACVAADGTLTRRAAIIQSVPGLGPVNSACLCAQRPELGQVGRRQAAVGLPNTLLRENRLWQATPYARLGGRRLGALCAAATEPRLAITDAIESPFQHLSATGT